MMNRPNFTTSILDERYLNITGYTDYRSTVEITICGIVLIAIITISVIGNTAVICAIRTNHHLREQVSSLFLLNLCLTDLSCALFVMGSTLFTLILDVRWVTPIWCDFTCAANYCFIIVSMATLMFISADRYIAVRHALRYQQIVTPRRVGLVIGYTWIQGLIFAIIPVTLRWIHYDYWEVTCAIDWQSGQGPVIYVILAFTVCFAVPGVSLVTLYYRTSRYVKRSIVDSQQAPTSSDDSPHVSIQKSLTSLLVVVILFFFFMTPFSITKLIKVLVPSPDWMPNYVNLVAAYTAFLSSMVNPFVYGIFRPEFQNAYRHMLYMLQRKRRANSTIPELYTSNFSPSMKNCDQRRATVAVITTREVRELTRLTHHT